jgi:hypothetical protein
MLFPRSDGRDNFLRKDVLRPTATPLGGGGDATRRSLSCDDTVPAEPLRLAWIQACGAADESRTVLRFVRGIVGGGGIEGDVGDALNDS